MNQAEPGTHGRDVAVAPPQTAWAGLEETRKAGGKARFQLPPPLWGTRSAHKPPEQKVQGPANSRGRRGTMMDQHGKGTLHFLLELDTASRRRPNALKVLHCP